jgi:poly-gamma-glutamate system protein
MKKLYWRPHGISSRVLLLLAAATVAGVVSVETFRVQKKQRAHRAKLTAARLTARAFQAIGEERLKRGLPVDKTLDPSRSGMIGQLISTITTNTGHLGAKQITTNPNFAAVVVHLLDRAEVGEGDVVAVGQSGSFPALNIATLAAIKAIKARPLVISSAGSSQWGANMPGFAWPDMERALRKRGLISARSLAMTLGGIDDRGIGLSPEGIQQLEAAIARNRYSRLGVESYEDSLAKRMALYRQHAGGEEIKAYVNVGGGTTSVGTAAGKKMFREGLNRYLPRGGAAIDSVMTRFAKRGVPVIHLTKISKLAQRYGLPDAVTSAVPLGEGKIFAREEYNLWLAGGVLLGVLLLMVAFLRMDLGYRLFTSKPNDPAAGSPEPMV